VPEPSSFMDFVQAGATSAMGAIIGTAVKLFTNPPTSLGRWFVESFVRISVGTFTGASLIEYWHTGPWVGSSCAVVAAMLSDEIIRAVDKNGKRLRRVHPPLPFEQDDTGD
jgi:hypothetical protein